MLIAPPAHMLLGVSVHPLTIPDLNAEISRAIRRGERRIVGNHNLHSIYLCGCDPHMRGFYARADYVFIDGMALVVLGKLLGLPLKRRHRVTYVDWVGPLMAEAARQGWRVFYLGSRPGVAEKGAQILGSRFAGLQIETAHGFFDARPGSAENEARLAKINIFHPGILMVGMGMPRQERWILENFELVNANVILDCGSCIDYVAGAVPVPPRWMGKIGMEWLCRLASEPRRLWKRYLIEPWFVSGLFARDLWNRIYR